MFRFPKRLMLLFGVLALPFSAMAAAPVEYIDVYVLPYYEAAQSKNGRPHVAVARHFDHLLSSNKRADIAAVRDMIHAQPERITPMTLMVLAIRLYDVGLRDDSVFWFYVAKDRFITLAEVLDMRSPDLAPVGTATRDFAALAGQTINGYAFCDIDKQQALRMQALEWVEKNPYQALFVPQLPARPGDRSTNLQRALHELRAQASEERAYLTQPDNVAMVARARKDNKADERYCWEE